MILIYSLHESTYSYTSLKSPGDITALNENLFTWNIKKKWQIEKLTERPKYDISVWILQLSVSSVF